MTVVNIGTRQQAIYNSLVPPEGPKVVSIPLDFTATQSVELDFTLAYAQTTISVVQCLWIDNFNNAQSLTVTVAGTQQTIEVPAQAQGVFPIIAAIRPKISITTTGGVIIPSLWLNVPLPVGVWYKGGGQTVAITGNVGITGVVATHDTPPSSTPTAPDAFAVVTGGTPVTAFAAGTVPLGAILYNSHPTESLFVDFVNVAGTVSPGASGTTIEVQPQQQFTVPGGITTAVSVNAVTAGHAFAGARL